AKAALEDADTLEAALAEDLRDARALLLLGARAVGDDHLLGLEVDRRALGLLGLEPGRARELPRARLEIGLGPHVEPRRLAPALDEADDRRRRAPEAVLPPPLAPHPAVDADAHERDAERRQRPRERLGRRVLDLLLRLRDQVLDVGEVRYE